MYRRAIILERASQWFELENVLLLTPRAENITDAASSVSGSPRSLFMLKLGKHNRAT